MKKNTIIQKSFINKRFTDIKNKYYDKSIISNYEDIGFILKNYYNVERLYVDNINVAETSGKAIYIEFTDGSYNR